MAPLIVILGETASGKTAAGLQLAQQIDGEIICADSRTIYKGMDIGTAKPTLKEQHLVKHHLLDILEPDQKFSAAEFKRRANKLIDEIWARGKFPIVVGGTGLYIDSLLFDYQFNIGERVQDPNNPRHLLASRSESDKELRLNTFVCGLKIGRDVLKQRIEDRVEQMFNDGFLDEIKMLASKYGWENESMAGAGYKLARDLFEGRATEMEVKEAFISRDTSLAKRQRTWFKRNPNIHWYDDKEKLLESAEEFSSRFILVKK